MNSGRPLPRGSASYGPAASRRDEQLRREAAIGSYDDELRHWYGSGALPLYGLDPQWRGLRGADEPGLGWPGPATAEADSAGAVTPAPSGQLTRVDKLTLIHLSPEGGRLKVASYRASTSRRYIDAVGSNALRKRAGPEAMAPDWGPAVIPVDGRPVTFRVRSGGDEWVALTLYGDIYLLAEGSAFPLEKVALTRIHDTGPYLHALVES